MSVLETPRIYFRGNVAWDPITTNNDPSFYDETDAEPIYNEAAKRVQAFRQEAIDAVVKGLWNPHGTHRSTFFDSAISGTDLGAGLVQNDPFINSPAIFRGMLVDLEPYGAFSSQLFFDSMTFGVDGGCRITAPRNMRFTARYINFGRNAVGAIAGVASVVWQTSFARDEGLSIDAFDSPALQALQKALDTDDVFGLTVQWSAYRTIYYGTPVQRNKDIAPLATELTKKLNSGGFQPNPARSMVVGVIGLWRKGEPAHEPSDRTLINVPNGDHTKAPTVVAAHVRITPNSIVLDLSNSVSETDLTLTKANVGDLRVVAVPSNASPVTLATFAYAQYDKTAYEKTSGILTLPITAAAAHIAESSDLQLQDSSGKVLLAESALRALPLIPNLYTSEGEKRNATIQVYDRGVRSTAGIPVLVCVMSADGGAVDSTISLTTGADGTVSFGLDTAAAGITAYVPLPGLAPTLPPKGIDPQVNTYMYVRVLPADDNIAKLPPTWDNVYTRVLANWHAMAPCMDNWLNLGSEPQVRAFAPLIKRLTDEGAFENFMYMPVVRDLTRGGRTLLYNFLDSKPSAVVMEAMTAIEPALPNFAELSKKMRSM